MQEIYEAGATEHIFTLKCNRSLFFFCNIFDYFVRTQVYTRAFTHLYPQLLRSLRFFIPLYAQFRDILISNQLFAEEQKEMKYLPPYAFQRFFCCILTDFVVNIFNAVYASLRTTLYVLYDSLTFFTCNLSSNVEVIICKCKPYVHALPLLFLFTQVNLRLYPLRKYFYMICTRAATLPVEKYLGPFCVCKC